MLLLISHSKDQQISQNISFGDYSLHTSKDYCTVQKNVYIWTALVRCTLFTESAPMPILRMPMLILCKSHTVRGYVWRPLCLRPEQRGSKSMLLKLQE